MKRLAARAKGLWFANNWLRRPPMIYQRARSVFDELLEKGLEERIEWTERRLVQVLDRASGTAYGRKMGSKPLTSWPYLSKETVKTDPGAFVAGSVWLAVPASTGGSSGLPLKLWRSLGSLAVEQAALDRLLVAKGIDPRRARRAVLRGESFKDPSDFSPPFWRFGDRGREMVMSSLHLTPGTAPVYVDQLAAFEPEYLWVYPSSLEALCALVLQQGGRLRVPVVLSSSEVLPQRVRGLASAALGCQVIDYYGQAERVAFAYSFQEREYRFLPGYAHVELLPAGSREDYDLYEVVGTCLWNTAMPLIRYRTGDLVRVSRGLDEKALTEICHGCASFLGVEGREQEYVISPDGARLIGLNHLAWGLDDVIQMQIIQKSRQQLRVLVVAGPRYNADSEAQLMSNLRAYFPASMSTEVDRVERLHRTASGKTPFIIREVD